MNPILTTLLFLFLLITFRADAAEFDIYQAEYKPVQMALMVFSEEQTLAADVELYQRLAARDLTDSQSFVVLNPLSYLPTAAQAWTEIDYSDWRLIGAEIVVLCKLSRDEKGWRALVRIHDPFRNKLLGESEMALPAGHLFRRMAHRTANLVYKTVTGIEGYFDTHILYVRKHGDQSDLMYMDQDGDQLQAVGQNFTLLLSPDWAPNGRQVVLNTYVGNRPRIETFDLATGVRTAIAAFSGLNSTPEYSPDGRYIAAALSFTGNTELHIYDTRTGEWRQLTHFPGIDTSPSWSPDGQWIAFTSDRDGSPQIYRINVASGETLRVSTVGNYNTSPAWSPTGDRIALISMKNWEYAVATIKLDGSGIRYLATGKRVESPVWAPNGQMLLYTAENAGIRQVYMVPSRGGRARAITPSTQDGSDAAWSK